jgi:hypothetical protein
VQGLRPWSDAGAYGALPRSPERPFYDGMNPEEATVSERAKVAILLAGCLVTVGVIVLLGAHTATV